MAIDLNTALHVMSGSEINLTCGFDGKLEVLPSTPTQYEASWEIECDNYTGEKNVAFTLDSQNVDAAVHKIKTPAVPNDAKGYYQLVYRLTVSKKPRASRECAIWPDTLDISAVYKHKGTGARAKRNVNGVETEYKDGDAVVGFPFIVQQGDHKTDTQYTNTLGTSVATLTLPQGANIVPLPPWEIVDPPTTALEERPRNRTINVCRTPYTVEIFSQSGGRTKTAPFQQFVNLPLDVTAAQGEKIQIRICAKGEKKLAQFGDKVFYRVTFDATNCKRNKPVPQVYVNGAAVAAVAPAPKPGEGARIFEGEVEIQSTGEAFFDIGLGYAGGDTCKVEVGTTDARGDDTLYIQNWRKIEYWVAQPKSDGSAIKDGGTRLTEHTLKGVTGFSPTMSSAIKTALDEVFVQFENKKAIVFSSTDLPPAFRKNVMDRGYFDGGGTGDVLAVSHEDLAAEIFQKKMVGPEKYTVRVSFADYTVSMAKWSQTIEAYKEGKLTPAGKIFKYCLSGKVLGGSTVGHGDFAITQLKWKAIKYADKTATLLDPSGDYSSAWKPITDPTHPGFGKEGTLTTETDICKMVEFVNWRYFNIKFPTGTSLPGSMKSGTSLEGTDSAGKACYILLSLEFSGVIGESYLGSASQGDMVIRTSAGELLEAGIGATITHELGHNMGQTYLAADCKTMNDPWGRGASHDIPGIPPPARVKDVSGVVSWDYSCNYYSVHGHQGNHCATGISVPDRELRVTYAGLSGSCVMFGEGNTNPKFCVNCKPFVKAEDVSDIRKSWK